MVRPGTRSRLIISLPPGRALPHKTR
ncbi:hypothetical protein E2C01_018943 [Portunus trituberculatus]|uniref:Uncharacterized protein n=1 Tax=Portunus trituberculatus TaxID=210409 RepID=A0A5B7DWD5_PORTR|nr:hypothetical protein [Portunus trituberculatus]